MMIITVKRFPVAESGGRGEDQAALLVLSFVRLFYLAAGMRWDLRFSYLLVYNDPLMVFSTEDHVWNSASLNFLKKPFSPKCLRVRQAISQMKYLPFLKSENYFLRLHQLFIPRLIHS